MIVDHTEWVKACFKGSMALSRFAQLDLLVMANLRKSHSDFLGRCSLSGNLWSPQWPICLIDPLVEHQFSNFHKDHFGPVSNRAVYSLVTYC